MPDHPSAQRPCTQCTCSEQLSDGGMKQVGQRRHGEYTQVLHSKSMLHLYPLPIDCDEDCEVYSSYPVQRASIIAYSGVIANGKAPF
jgi:hypothetical protein